MKGRIKFFNYFIACIATLSLATFAACSDDDPETPSGKLVLTARLLLLSPVKAT